MNRCILSQATSCVSTDAVARLLNAGHLDLYTGPQPASPDDSVNGQTKLLRIPLGDPAFAKAVAGRAEARKTWESEPAIAAGEAKWFRACGEDGSVVMDGSVGLSNADIVLDDVNVKVGSQAIVRAFAFGVRLSK